MPERIDIPERQPPTPELLPNPENADIRPVERAPTPTAERQPRVTLPPIRPQQPVKEAPDPVLQDVEAILSDDIADAYVGMDPLTKREFKEQGEASAKEIRTLLGAAKLKVHEVVKIIVEWLRMIPGVSRLFVEQEAKIKTDRLIVLHKASHEKPKEKE